MTHDAQHWFIRLFGLAVVAHVVGNPPLAPDLLGVASLGLGVIAAVMITQPDWRLLAASSVLVPITAWLEAPQLGNHWLLMSFVSIAVLLSLTRRDWWVAFAPVARWILLVFYAFAAFSKLNAGFFDGQTSCAVFYANQSLSSWGLPTVPGSGAVPLAIAVVSALIELSVPVLLVVPSLRRPGVVLGYTFHFVISLDLDQHFYDFTAVLFALFMLFAPTASERLERSVAPWFDTPRRVLAITLTVLFVLAAVLPLTRLSLRILTPGFFVVWIPIAAATVIATIAWSRDRSDISLRLPGLAATVLVAVVVLNGMTPYLELKTGFGFNMYSNLVTANGETNHFIVPRTVQLTDANADPLVIISTDDSGLAAYVGSDYAVTRARLADYLAERPDVRVTYRVSGTDAALHTTGASFGEPMSSIARKLSVFRSIDLQSPPRCPAIWLPAL